MQGHQRRRPPVSHNLGAHLLGIRRCGGVSHNQRVVVELGNQRRGTQLGLVVYQRQAFRARFAEDPALAGARLQHQRGSNMRRRLRCKQFRPERSEHTLLVRSARNMLPPMFGGLQGSTQVGEKYRQVFVGTWPSRPRSGGNLATPTRRIPVQRTRGHGQTSKGMPEAHHGDVGRLLRNRRVRSMLHLQSQLEEYS